MKNTFTRLMSTPKKTYSVAAVNSNFGDFLTLWKSNMMNGTVTPNPISSQNMVLCVVPSKAKPQAPRINRSTTLRIKYNPSSTGTIRDRGVSTSISGFLSNERDAHTDSKITIGKPTAIAEIRKNNGSQGVYQSGCIL